MLGAVLRAAWRKEYLYCPGPGFLECFSSGIEYCVPLAALGTENAETIVINLISIIVCNPVLNMPYHQQEAEKIFRREMRGVETFGDDWR
jgi:hypothetical protein